MAVTTEMGTTRNTVTNTMQTKCAHTHNYVGGCQNYGPSLGPYYSTAPSIWGTQKGTFILTTTHKEIESLDQALSELLGTGG